MTPPQLRPYQLRAIEGLRACVTAGRRAPLVVAPTGAGKTTVFCELARLHLEQGGHVLVLVHRTELLQQAADRLGTFGIRAGIIAASDTRGANPFARCQVAMVPTLISRGVRPKASMVINDEAHLSVAAEWRQLNASYDDALRIGFTATPFRADGTGLGELYDDIVPVASIRELTDAGHLVPCEILRPKSSLRSGQIAQRPVDAYLEHARGQRAVVFSPHVKAAVEHTTEFREAGVQVACITGDMDPMVRRRALADYEAGRVSVLVNVMVLTAGWDSPSTSCAILARGFGHLGLYLQVVGRILRPAPGKDRALLVDLRGITHVLGDPDQDVEYSLDGAGVRKKDDVVTGALCAVCGVPLVDGRCTDCMRPGIELEAPTVVGVALSKYERMRQDTDEERAERLSKWILDARAKGHKEGAALYRYSAVYGGWPSPSIKRAALDRARGAA
jgi:DNA repair protein RadD